MTQPYSYSRRAGAVLALVLSAVTACVDAPISAPATGSADDALLQAVLAMGFRRENVVDQGSHFLVEGDISISKLNLMRQLGLGPSFQYRASGIVSLTNVDYIIVDGSALESTWQTALSDAIAEWNAITPGVVIHFDEGPFADIVATMSDNLSFTSCSVSIKASAQFPSFDTPGSFIHVSNQVTQNGCLSASQKKRAMAHELGHTIGLRHTDSPCGGGDPSTCGASLIPGTPTTDTASVMRSAIGTGTWIGFTQGDKAAAFWLYHQTDNPNVEVSYPGGVPTFSWSAVPGAPTYAIGYMQYWWNIDQQSEFWSGVDYYYGPTTTGTSTTWQGLPHTGFSACEYGPGGGFPGTSYLERTFFVQIYFPSGSYGFPLGPAEVVPCP